MPTWTPDVTSDTSGSTQEITVAVENPASGSEGTVTTTRTPNIIGSSDIVTYSEYEDLSALLLEDIDDIATRPNPDIVLNATYRVALDLSAIDISDAYLLIDLRKWAFGQLNSDPMATSTSLDSVLTSVTGSDKADFIIGTDGADTRNGGGGNDRLVGGKGDDTLNGGDGDDLLIGGQGADRLDGGDGDDMLIGGDGDDTLTGGDGDDRFVLSADDTGSDTVTDFGTGSDKVRVNSTANTETTLAALGLSIAASGSDAVIYTDNDGSYNSENDILHMTLQGFSASSWNDSTHLDVV